MTRATTAAAVLVAALVLLALAVGYRTPARTLDPAAETPPAIAPPAAAAPDARRAADSRGFLYGRVATTEGEAYEGRLRFGGNGEASWGDTFNGFKDENPWAALVPAEELPRKRRSVAIFGLQIARRESPIELGRPFLARFGDLARIEARGRDVRVTLKSGTAFDLARSSASDFDDGVRVWDAERGVVDLDSRRIRAIGLLPTPPLAAAPERLHGTVRTSQGDFTGFIQWNREQGVGTDELDGRGAGGELGLRFDTIRSITRRPGGGSRVMLRDGREMTLSGARDVDRGNRGVFVEDPHYGRVLVSWEAFERADFDAGGSGPAYDDFPPGRPLTGGVTTRAGRRLAGRLVYDLDESETTETLDAPSGGVNYTILFGLIASIVPDAGEDRGTRRAEVTLHGGETLRLERAGDLGDDNGGLLVYADGGPTPEYVRWADVGRIDLDRPPGAALDPPALSARPFFFALSVADVERSADWYRRVLGFQVARAVEFEGGRIRTLARDDAFLELVGAAGSRDLADLEPPIPRRHLLRGAFKVGFEVPDLDEAIGRLEALGVPLRGRVVTEEDGSMRSAQVEDPDGNVVQLFERLAG